MPSYQTPGVYVEEISLLPPSVAQVATAIPAFIGYTKNGGAAVEVAQINSLLEYEQRFGKAKTTAFTIKLDDTLDTYSATPASPMWYALDLYFRNGGGRCYVVSVGSDGSAAAKAGFQNGLTKLESYDEPTLIVMPGAVALSATDHHDLCQQALSHCKKMGDRFALLDVEDVAAVADVDDFRGGVTSALDYGAAYYPHLVTTAVHQYDEAEVDVEVQIDGVLPEDPPQTITVSLANIRTEKTGDPLAPNEHFDLTRYNAIKKLLSEQRVVLPPSAAIAGVYARVDRERGVWKAPANVGVAGIASLTRKLTDAEQETLNIDTTAGKSINAIRTFPGKGTLVWGARTLAGNDNEWRYVPVRRLFIMIEESCKKASAFAVFEPNDATTWAKVKGMIDSYLHGLWEQGALQGAKPEEAFYVHVGLGKTMSPQDVLEGRMIVQIGIAAVRPAEFVVLRFSHKLATA